MNISIITLEHEYMVEENYKFSTHDFETVILKILVICFLNRE